MLPVNERSVQAFSIMKRSAILVCLIAVAACESMAPSPTVDLRALQQEAERLLAVEEFEQALRTYGELANASSGSERSRFLIAGVKILIQLQAYDSAREWLSRAAAEATPDQAQRLVDLLDRMSAAERGGAAGLTRVALLLPLTGPQRQAAIAIQDGFLAAHLTRFEGGTQDAPTLRVYDTGSLGAREAYRRAREDGADFVVGPLLKPELEAILDSAGVTPTLALNSLEHETSAANFYQFALAPEDEASQVARYAVANGAVNAAALIPRNEWGDRLLQSFRMQFEALGGHLLQVRTYDPTAQDFSAAITTALNIDKSEQRRQRLGAALGTSLDFESRRRQDIDAIFVAADAGAGRLLAPQLRFYFAGDIPTYATSAIYESSNQNGDLNGLLFADTPWVLLDEAAPRSLATALQRYWPQRTSAQWIRFYGFGFDAYRLITELDDQPSALVSFPALSGELSLHGDGRVRRELPVAQFRNGKPAAVGLEAGTVPEVSPEFTGLR